MNKYLIAGGILMAAAAFGGVKGFLDKRRSSAGEAGEAAAAELSFDSFDGGGPVFNVVFSEDGIASCSTECIYAREDHENLCGAGYRVILTFRGLTPGTTEVTVEERSPIAENLDHRYVLTVDEDLNVVLTDVSTVQVTE